jgi:hypothetical protein
MGMENQKAETVGQRGTAENGGWVKGIAAEIDNPIGKTAIGKSGTGSGP